MCFKFNFMSFARINICKNHTCVKFLFYFYFYTTVVFYSFTSKKSLFGISILKYFLNEKYVIYRKQWINLYWKSIYWFLFGGIYEFLQKSIPEYILGKQKSSIEKKVKWFGKGIIHFSSFFLIFSILLVFYL